MASRSEPVTPSDEPRHWESVAPQDTILPAETVTDPGPVGFAFDPAASVKIRQGLVADPGPRPKPVGRDGTRVLKAKPQITAPSSPAKIPDDKTAADPVHKRKRRIRKLKPSQPNGYALSAGQLSNEAVDAIPVEVLYAALPMRFTALRAVAPVGKKHRKHRKNRSETDQFVFGARPAH